MIRVFVVLAIVAAAAGISASGSSASPAYRAFAVELLQAKPKGAVIRSDLAACNKSVM